MAVGAGAKRNHTVPSLVLLLVAGSGLGLLAAGVGVGRSFDRLADWVGLGGGSFLGGWGGGVRWEGVWEIGAGRL